MRYLFQTQYLQKIEKQWVDLHTSHGRIPVSYSWLWTQQSHWQPKDTQKLGDLWWISWDQNGFLYAKALNTFGKEGYLEIRAAEGEMEIWSGSSWWASCEKYCKGGPLWPKCLSLRNQEQSIPERKRGICKLSGQSFKGGVRETEKAWPSVCLFLQKNISCENWRLQGESTTFCKTDDPKRHWAWHGWWTRVINLGDGGRRIIN